MGLEEMAEGGAVFLDVEVFVYPFAGVVADLVKVRIAGEGTERVGPGPRGIFG